MSHGIEIVLGIGTTVHGNGGSGITLWTTGPPARGTTVSFAFQIPGL